MLSHRAKLAFFFLADPLMRLNRYLYYFFRAPRIGTVRIHLGPGQGNYLANWINLDANMFTGQCDVWVNLNNALPFHESTVDAAYSHHVVEHLSNLAYHFADVFRSLKPGGVYRVGGPNGDSAIRKFVENDSSWFGDFPTSRNSIGGRFENFIFCKHEHMTVLTFSFLQELMTDAGFVNIKRCLPKSETFYPHVFDAYVLEKEWESDFDCPHTLVVEAEKPKLGA
jgi:predicted SAM-dependent methyltransferase